MSIEQRLKDLGLALPPAPRPVGNYVPGVLVGNLLFMSGVGPRRADGSAVTGKLGAGGRGGVYRAIDTRSGDPVAVKVLPDRYAGDTTARGRFKREVHALMALSHPNILRIFDFHTADGVFSDAHDDVADPDAGLIGGTAHLDFRHDPAGQVPFEPQALAHSVREGVGAPAPGVFPSGLGGDPASLDYYRAHWGYAAHFQDGSGAG